MEINPQVIDFRKKEYSVNRKIRADRIIELSLVYGYICWYCGIKLQGEEVHLDHIISRSRGGNDDLSNIALCCSQCNYAKQDNDLDTFLTWLDFIRFGPALCPIRSGLRLETKSIVIPQIITKIPIDKEIEGEMAKKVWGKKLNYPVVAARIPPELYTELKRRFPNPGDISKLIRALLQKYADGRIIGVRLEV